MSPLDSEAWTPIPGAMRVQKRYTWISDDRTTTVYVLQQQWESEHYGLRWEDVPLVDENGKPLEWPRP